MRRGYARHLTILFPAILIVAVYFLIQPRQQEPVSPAAEPVTQQGSDFYRHDSEDYQAQRALRREVTREVMIEHGLIEPDQPEDHARTLMRDLMQGGEDDREAVLADVRLRLLERGIEPGRWFRRHWDEQLQSTFSPWGVGGFEGRGVTLGDTVSSMTVHAPDGAEVSLAKLWADRPTLIVTGSITCPITHQRIAELDALTQRFDGRVNVVLVYTTEALPSDAPAPGPAGDALSSSLAESETPKHAQTTSLAQRTQNAVELRDSLGVKTPIFIDRMDNAVWQTFGQAPSAALLVTTDGKVAVKQGWFDAYTMAEAADELLNKP